MAKPTTDLTKERYFEEVHLFFKTFAEICRDSEECKRFMREMFTPSEMRMLKKRWYIGRLLMSGMDVRSVASEAEVSTTTVVRISQLLKKDGSYFKKVLQSLLEGSNIEAEPPILEEANSLEENGPKNRYIFGHE